MVFEPNLGMAEATDGICHGETVEDPIVDPAGYLPCGCHGTQREHTCDERDYPEYDLSQEI